MPDHVARDDAEWTPLRLARVLRDAEPAVLGQAAPSARPSLRSRPVSGARQNAPAPAGPAVRSPAIPPRGPDPRPGTRRTGTVATPETPRPAACAGTMRPVVRPRGSRRRCGRAGRSRSRPALGCRVRRGTVPASRRSCARTRSSSCRPRRSPRPRAPRRPSRTACYPSRSAARPPVRPTTPAPLHPARRR
jgi:hypothetical protein